MHLLLTGSIALVLVASSAGVAQTPPSGASRHETYQSAVIDPDDNLAIVTSTAQIVIVRNDGEWTSLSPPVLSSDHTAVAALAMLANCCTPYDIPLELIVYTAGKVHRFKGVGLPVVEWGFAGDGARVAYGQRPADFGCATHYELRETESERLIESVDIPEPCARVPDPKPVEIPPWVADLQAASSGPGMNLCESLHAPLPVSSVLIPFVILAVVAASSGWLIRSAVRWRRVAGWIVMCLVGLLTFGWGRDLIESGIVESVESCEHFGTMATVSIVGAGTLAVVVCAAGAALGGGSGIHARHGRT